MKETRYTAEQLADRFMDIRAIENTMGRYVNSLLLKQENTILHDYWSRFESDLCYALCANTTRPCTKTPRYVRNWCERCFQTSWAGKATRRSTASAR